MVRHYQVGCGKHLPLQHLYNLHRVQTPTSHLSGMGYAGVHKKDVGSMRSVGQGLMKKKIAPLRFKI
jgi:hypothetical protein